MKYWIVGILAISTKALKLFQGADHNIQVLPILVRVAATVRISHRKNEGVSINLARRIHIGGGLFSEILYLIIQAKIPFNYKPTNHSHYLNVQLATFSEA